MSLITRKEFTELSKVHEDVCISIFIPTHRAGAEVIQKKDALILKNKIREASLKLKNQEYSRNDMKQLINPLEEMVEDSSFWAQQSDGLAIFRSRDLIEKFTLPVHFEAFQYVSSEFYLKPLMPLFHGDGKFFILTLTLRGVNFYEATRYSITDIIIDDLVPKHLEEAVGYDYEQKGIQFRSQQEGHGQASFHGHGEGKDDRKEEIRQYLRSVDKGLMKMLHDEKAPKVVVAQDHLFSLYQEVNNYPYMMKKHISSNPQELDKFLIHEHAWEIVSPEFDLERLEKIKLTKRFNQSPRTSADIQEIIPAAFEGKIDTLFLQNRTDIWGIYYKQRKSVEIDQKHDHPNVSLSNMAAINAFLNGGKVFLLEKEDMPIPGARINALFRF